MELFDVFVHRRSVRKFKETAVSAEIISDIVRAAELAPETDTCQYFFGVVTDSTLKKRIASCTHYSEWVATAPVLFVCCCDISWDIGERNIDDYGVVGNALRYGNEIVDFLIKHPYRKACATLTLATPVYIPLSI